MKREQIIEILNVLRRNRGSLGELTNNDIADAIMALPIDVPSEDEIKDNIWYNDPVNNGDYEWKYGFRQGQLTGANWAIDEIIRRNK
jgi:hypothetical protein